MLKNTHALLFYKELTAICCKARKEKLHVANLQVVFRGGEGALQVLPPLVDVIPEARLNLVSIKTILFFDISQNNFICSYYVAIIK